MVTHHLAKVGHAGPIPVRRLFFSLLCSVYISVAPSHLWFCHKLMEFYISLNSNRSNIKKTIGLLLEINFFLFMRLEVEYIERNIFP